MPSRTKVCSYIDKHGKSCPELQPCEKHTRPKNARWSKDRDPAAQARFRKTTLERDSYCCQRCGHVDRTGKTLDAHHVSPDRGVTLCNDCHCLVDPNARRRAR